MFRYWLRLYFYFSVILFRNRLISVRFQPQRASQAMDFVKTSRTKFRVTTVGVETGKKVKSGNLFSCSVFFSRILEIGFFFTTSEDLLITKTKIQKRPFIKNVVCYPATVRGVHFVIGVVYEFVKRFQYEWTTQSNEIRRCTTVRADDSKKFSDRKNCIGRVFEMGIR